MLLALCDRTLFCCRYNKLEFLAPSAVSYICSTTTNMMQICVLDVPIWFLACQEYLGVVAA